MFLFISNYKVKKPLNMAQLLCRGIFMHRFSSNEVDEEGGQVYQLEDYEKIFQELKKRLMSAPILAIPEGT